MWFWTLVTPYKPKQYAILVKQKGNHKKFRDKKEFQSWITTILMIANWNCTDGVYPFSFSKELTGET
jgi:hypothetical protein